MSLNRIKKIIRYATIGGILTCQFQANATEIVTVLCPESLNVTETASELEAGWDVVVDRGRRAYKLDGVRIYLGHPREMGSLVPDSVRREAGLQKTTWLFSKSVSDQYWIACSYQNTKLLAIKKLAPDLASCQIKEQLLPSGTVLKLKSVHCQ